MIVTGTSVAQVSVCVPDGLEARERVREDPNPFTCGECVKDSVDSYKICPHDGAGFICSTGVDVYGGACRDMHHRSP